MFMLRMTLEEYKTYSQRKNKRSKYRNRRTEYDGYTFDSKAEAEYYKLLKLRKRAKEIKSFLLQPEYLLQEAFEKDGKKYREIKYIADFEITHNDGSIEVVDVKGTLTQVFKLKMRMFHKLYPYKLTLVKLENGRFVELDN